MKTAGKLSAGIAIGVVALLALAVVPSITGAASSASPAGAAVPAAAGTCPPSTSTSGGHSSGPADTQWAYGGEGWSNWSFTNHIFTFSYNSTFGWTVVFSVVTNTTTGVTFLSEQRTLGITVWANATSPNVTAHYLYHAFESDGAFANVTNHSTVYVGGTPVPALGILNASVAACSAVHQAITIANQTVTRSGDLNVTGEAEASVSFSPSLGLIPLNLSGVQEWNSSSTATTAASWNVSYAYLELNGTSGSGSRVGSLSGSYPVNLTGFKFEARHSFCDHKSRVGVVLVLEGPFDGYDGFILVPRAFDFFGTLVHGYSPYAFGSASISSESLYLSPGPGGVAVTAADQSFAAVNTGMNGFVGSHALVTNDGVSSPSATVEGQPMSVGQAQAIDHALAASPTFAAPSSPHGSAALGLSEQLVALVVGAIIVAVVGVVAALALTSSSRRRAAETGAPNPTVPPSVENPASASSFGSGTHGSSESGERDRPE